MRKALLNQTIINRFRKIGKQENENPLVIAKFFNPYGSQTWYATEYDENEHLCYGFVTGLYANEWGYFSITELQSLRCPPFGLPIERDKYFNETRFNDLNID